MKAAQQSLHPLLRQAKSHTQIQRDNNMKYTLNRRGGSTAMSSEYGPDTETGIAQNAERRADACRKIDPRLALVIAHFRDEGGSRTPSPHERPIAHPEVPLYPRKLPRFPPVTRLLRLPPDEQERRLEKRAAELLLEIEGLRTGVYVTPPGKSRAQMLENARRRVRRLRNTAMQLGFWTDGHWDAVEEETHVV